MFAQKYHTSMKYVGSIRRELGIRTVFNILGPLTNPAHPTAQLLGVYDESLVDPLARVLTSLGVTPERPRMELMGHDGNIFAILGRAAKLLRENGQNAASVEMRRRVTHCDNYYKALGIISEYVETELSVPRDLPPDPARRKKEKQHGGEAR